MTVTIPAELAADVGARETKKVASVHVEAEHADDGRRWDAFAVQATGGHDDALRELRLVVRLARQADTQWRRGVLTQCGQRGAASAVDARLAAPVAVDVDQGVLVVVRVALDAPGHGTSATAPVVLSWRHCLEVAGVQAGGPEAEVVDLVPLGDGPDEQRVSEAMNRPLLPLPGGVRVALRAQVAVPEEALVGDRGQSLAGLGEMAAELLRAIRGERWAHVPGAVVEEVGA